MAENEVTGEIVATERLNCSVNGNPRWRIVILTQVDGITDSRILLTSSDISDAYAVGNPGFRRGDRVRFTLTRAGRITHMHAA